MSYEQRNPRDYFFATLSSAAAISDTSLIAANFANLPNSLYSTTNYLPIILHDPASGLYETAWVTAHTASSTTVTVVRGREGTSARAWASGTQVVCAPTAGRDGLSALARASLPSDPHYGQRIMVTDENLVVERTQLAGWQASVGAANPADFGVRQAGTAIPSGAVILARGGIGSGTTNGSGRISTTFTQPFPTEGLTAVCLWQAGTGNYVIALQALTNTTLTVYYYKPSDGTIVGSGMAASFAYIAYGY